MIEKGINPAPTGEMAEGSGLEVEIVNPEMVTLDDGSVEITIVPDAKSPVDTFDGNVADIMEEKDLNILASDIVEMVDTTLGT